MAGRLYRMAKVVSANPSSWGIVDANQISGFRTVATEADLYSIAACILSSSYGDGTTTGADAVGQIWHVQNSNKDYRLTNWSARGTSEGWTEELTSTALVNKINTAENKADIAISKANALATVVDSKANQSTVNTLAGQLTEVNRAVDTNRSAINTVKESVATNKQNITNLTSQLQTTNTNLNNFKALKGATNGLATLDAQGRIPLDQLANLDTTVYKVLGQNDALPTTNIKSCIYLKLIESGNPTGDNNKYAEYVYTGNITGTYDATKWEKLGEVSAKTDLSEYYKKSETYSASEVNTKVIALNNADIKSITSTIEVDKDDEKHGTNSLHVKLTKNDTTKVLDLKLPNATAENSGIMPKGYISKIDDAYIKLNGIEAGANKTIIDSTFSITSTNPVQNKIISTWKNTTEKNIDSASRLIAANKSKLDTIDEHANNYSHPTHTSATEGLYKVTIDNLGHVSHTTAVTKEDITKLGIPGSAPTVDTAMSSTSTNAVQNKVIYEAINNHIIDNDNLARLGSKQEQFSILGQKDSDLRVSALDEHLVYNYVPGGQGSLSIDGLFVLTEDSITALSETDVNNILNTPI